MPMNYIELSKPARQVLSAFIYRSQRPVMMRSAVKRVEGACSTRQRLHYLNRPDASYEDHDRKRCVVSSDESSCQHVGTDRGVAQPLRPRSQARNPEGP